MRAAIRLFVALTLMAWGQFTYAVDYFWQFSGSASQYSSATAACEAKHVSDGYSSQGQGSVFDHLVMKSATQAECFRNVPNFGVYPYGLVSRSGDSCPASGIYNPATGACDVPKDCKNEKPITVGVVCTYIPALKSSVCPSVYNVEGCEFVKTSAPSQSCEFQGFLGSNETLCKLKTEPSGNPATSGDPLPEGTYVETPDSSTTDPRCLKMGDATVCLSPDNAGCDLYNGKPWCYQTGDKCGTINGQFTCLPDSSRICDYVNGKLSCVATKNGLGEPISPTLIPPTSSDHPDNGGNADGRDDNDPLPSGGATGGASSGQGTKDGATNKTVQDGAQQVTDAVEKGNGILKDIYDGLFGDDYDGSGDGSDAEAEGQGGELGSDIAKKIGDESDAIGEEREQKLQNELDKINSTVEGWFGAGVGLNNTLTKLFPSATGCRNFDVTWSVKQLSFSMQLDICVLSRLKPLLEWVIWALTAIGVWRIYYAALRLENAKAEKGGF